MTDITAEITGQNIAVNFGSLDGISGGASLTHAHRLTAVTYGATIGESQIADGVTGGVLTISGALTANRTLTVPDANVTITGGGTIALSGYTLTAWGSGIVVRTADLAFARNPSAASSSFNSFPAATAGLAESTLNIAATVARANSGA